MFCKLRLVFERALWQIILLSKSLFVQLNYLLLIVLIYFSFSCQERSTRQENEVIGYSTDTLIIDSKERILDLNGWMLTSDLNDEETVFYLFNGSDLSIDEINLDRHEFVKSFPLEPEGANGVGEYIFGLQILDNSVFFTKSSVLSTLIDQNGLVIRRIDWDESRYSNETKLEQFPRKTEVLSDMEGLRAYGLTYDFNKKKVFLDILSDKEGTVKRFDVDPENSYHDFFFRFDDNLNFLEPNVDLNLENNQVLVSHEFSNEIIIFSLQGKLVREIQYEPTLTPKRAKIPQGPEFKSREQIGKDYQLILEQVRFESVVWDNLNQRYFRLSSKRIFKDTYENERSFTPDIKKTRIFLSVFDSDFNLISEMEIDELNDERVKYFAKDGKLWVAQNFSDELGFLVIDFEALK
jgi:hypothetical protein